MGIFARIVGALGGRAAEGVVFGEDEVTTSASGDLQQVSNMAKQLVTNYGMSEIGPWSLQDEGAQSQDMIMRMMSRNNTSEKLLEQIDDAVKKVSDEAYAKAEADRGQPRGDGQGRGDPVREGDHVGRRVPHHPGRVHGDPRGEPQGGPGHRDHQLDSPPRPPPASLRPLRGASAHARPVKICNTIIGTRAPSGRCGAARI